MDCNRSSLMLVFQRAVAISHGGQISRPRSRVQVAQQAVVPLLLFEFCHPALRIVYVAKDNRLGWTGRFASGGNLAVANEPILFLGFYLRPLYSLNAVCALLHDSA